jgi:hypothetical protein
MIEAEDPPTIAADIRETIDEGTAADADRNLEIRVAIAKPEEPGGRFAALFSLPHLLKPRRIRR